MSFWRRAGSTAADPRLGLTAAFLGGIAWATATVAAAPAVALGAGVYAAGVVVGGLIKGKDDKESDEEQLPELRKGTEQSALVDNLSAYINDLRTLRAGPKPDTVVDPSIEALVAAENAYGTAARVAAAIDGLDMALYRSGGPTNNQQVREAVQRMAGRRQALLSKLHGMVDEVAEVYTKLLEMSATISSMDVGEGATAEVEKVNGSLDSLRQTLADLEAQARRPANG